MLLHFAGDVAMNLGLAGLKPASIYVRSRIARRQRRRWVGVRGLCPLLCRLGDSGERVSSPSGIPAEPLPLTKLMGLASNFYKMKKNKEK